MLTAGTQLLPTISHNMEGEPTKAHLHGRLTLPDPVAYSTDPPTEVSLASTLNGPRVPSDVSLYANCKKASSMLGDWSAIGNMLIVMSCTMVSKVTDQTQKQSPDIKLNKTPSFVK